MKIELDIVKEIISYTKHFLEIKDYDGLNSYINEKEKFLDNYKGTNKESEYIDKLIGTLK